MKELKKLTKLEREVLLALQREVYKNSDITIKEMSEKYFVSTALISKLAKKLGYHGYSDMIFSLRNTHRQKHSTEEYIQNTEVMARLLYTHRDNKILITSGPKYSTVRDYLVRRMAMFDLFVVSTYDYQMVDNPTEIDGLLIGIDDGDFEMISELTQYAYEKGYHTVLLTDSVPDNSYHSIDVDFKIRYTGVLEADIITFMEYSLSLFSKLMIEGGYYE